MLAAKKLACHDDGTFLKLCTGRRQSLRLVEKGFGSK